MPATAAAASLSVVTAKSRLAYIMYVRDCEMACTKSVKPAGDPLITSPMSTAPWPLASLYFGLIRQTRLQRLFSAYGTFIWFATVIEISEQ